LCAELYSLLLADCCEVASRLLELGLMLALRLVCLRKRGSFQKPRLKRKRSTGSLDLSGSGRKRRFNRSFNKGLFSLDISNCLNWEKPV